MLSQFNQKEQSPSPKLKGTIVGGKRPIAIIDDQLYRMGDQIGEYKIILIGKNKVLLESIHDRIA